MDRCPWDLSLLLSWSEDKRSQMEPEYTVTRVREYEIIATEINSKCPWSKGLLSPYPCMEPVTNAKEHLSIAIMDIKP